MNCELICIHSRTRLLSCKTHYFSFLSTFFPIQFGSELHFLSRYLILKWEIVLIRATEYQLAPSHEYLHENTVQAQCQSLHCHNITNTSTRSTSLYKVYFRQFMDSIKLWPIQKGNFGRFLNRFHRLWISKFPQWQMISLWNEAVFWLCDWGQRQRQRTW